MNKVKPKTDMKNAKVALMQSAQETAAKQGKLRVTHAKKQVTLKEAKPVRSKVQEGECGRAVVHRQQH